MPFLYDLNEGKIPSPSNYHSESLTNNYTDEQNSHESSQVNSRANSLINNYFDNREDRSSPSTQWNIAHYRAGDYAGPVSQLLIDNSPSPMSLSHWERGRERDSRPLTIYDLPFTIYDKGFVTGGYAPAGGIVHEKEFVLRQEATERLGIPFLNALNEGKVPGFSEGGYVGPNPQFPIDNSQSFYHSPFTIYDSRSYSDLRSLPKSSEDSQPVVVQEAPLVVNIINNGNNQVSTQERRNQRGERELDVWIEEKVAGFVERPGGKVGNSMKRRFPMLSEYQIPR